MMSTVAHFYPFVIGVDTHARTHTYAVLAANGAHLGTEAFPNTHAGRTRAIAWASRRTGGDLEALWAIEGTGSYGALLAGTVARTGYRVVEAPRVRAYASARRGPGKSDPLDAAAIAASVLVLEQSQLRNPRQDDGVRAALRVLVSAREQMTIERTAKVNALTALLRTVDLGVDARRPLTDTKITEISHWRVRDEPIAAPPPGPRLSGLPNASPLLIPSSRKTTPVPPSSSKPALRPPCSRRPASVLSPQPWFTRRGRIWAECDPRPPSPLSPE